MKSAPSRSFLAAAAGIAAAAVLPAMLLAPLGSSGALALRSSQEAEALSDEEFASKCPFELSAVVVAVYPNGLLFLKDDSGLFEVVSGKRTGLAPGQTVKVCGHTYCEALSKVRNFAAESVEVTGAAEVPEPRAFSVDELLQYDGKVGLAKVRGTVTDAMADDIDPEWNYMMLRDGPCQIPVAVVESGDFRRRMADLVDAEVEVTGAVIPGHSGFRLFIGPFIRSWSDSCIKVLKDPPADPFVLPPIGDLQAASPYLIEGMGRRTASGRVLAVWGEGMFLLRTDEGRVMRVELADDSVAPSYGDRVKVVGYPETDLFRINFTRAYFRPEPHSDFQPELPEDAKPSDILFDENGRSMAKPSYHGRLVRIKGRACAAPSDNGQGKAVVLDCDGVLVDLDLSANPSIADGIDVGCVVEATGVCVLDSQNWRPSMIFPRIDRMFLVPRRPADLRVLSRRPWLTTGRLLVVLASLFATLLGILAWAVMLRVVARRTARALYRAEIANAAAELRLDERTRLAAELHDSVAQNLTGISMQIAAARSARLVSPDDEEKHLAVAERMMRSSLSELRRCIWDLRSDALDETDFAAAIEATVRPVVGRASLHVSCGAKRSRLNDTTAHSLLRIARELASNAVRHGKAANVWIGCEAAQGVLRLVVRDDGCGFDPESCAGPDEGHFGLKGIRERARRLGAEFTVESAPGKGTAAAVEIKSVGEKGDGE